MSYFPCDIPFMSDDELKGNGIRISKDVPDTNVGDTIYRKDAINAVEFGITYAKAFNTETGEWKELFEESNEELREAVKRLRDLPPAQPQQCMNTIRRSDAIDALIKAYTYIDPMSFTDVIMGVEDARPETNTDRWNRLMMYLADLQLTYSPNWGKNGAGDEKIYQFVTGLIEELESWQPQAEGYREESNA